MMKKRLGIRIATGLCAALGWWGLLYPELALTPDTVAVKATKQGAPKQALEWEFDSGLYQDLLNAGPDQITFRSRFLMDFSSLLEALHHGDKQ